jgi:hypothetical protein
MIRALETPSRGQGRRGISIIEVMIVISGVALLLGLCAISLRILMQLNVDTQARLSESRALEQLAGQFRADVHAATAVLLRAEPKEASARPRLRLQLEPDHDVTYRLGDGCVLRDETRSGKMVYHQSYALPRGRAGRFEERTEASHRLVALVMTPKLGKKRTDPAPPLEIVAAAGRVRLLKQEAGS